MDSNIEELTRNIDEYQCAEAFRLLAHELHYDPVLHFIKRN